MPYEVESVEKILADLTKTYVLPKEKLLPIAVQVQQNQIQIQQNQILSAAFVVGHKGIPTALEDITISLRVISGRS